MAKLEDVVLRGDRASQPVATGVAVGTIYGVTDEGNILERSNGTTWDPYSPSVAGGTINMGVCNFRLTLTTGVPVTTTDVTAATTVYATPFKGELIALYDAVSAWTLYAPGELSIAVPATTVTMYDLFMDRNGGTPQLTALAWTNDTTRATALTTQDGVLVRTGDTEQRYLGSFRTTGVSGETEDSLAKRFLWNYYNRALRPMRVLEATNSWTTVATSTIQQVNVSAANQLEFVVGVSEDTINANCQGLFTNSSGTWRQVHMGFGLNVTNAFTSGQLIGSATCAATVTAPITASYEFAPAVGYSFLAWLQAGAGTDTQTWYGDNNSPTTTQSGIKGNLWG